MWKEKFLTLLRTNRLAVLFTFCGIILMLIGVSSMVFSENTTQGVIIEEAASTSKNEDSRQIIVDVAGAVEKPGVYKLSEDSRLQEALIAAGGLSEDANREYVSKNINLAAKVSDGAKIYIPSKDESITSSGQSASGVVAGTTSGLININSASQSELESLPGIGPVTAGKIINARSYSSVEELLTKKIVGQKVFGDIKEKITTY